MTEENCNQCPHNVYCPDKGTENECKPEPQKDEHKLLMNINGKKELISFNPRCKSCILMQDYRNKGATHD